MARKWHLRGRGARARRGKKTVADNRHRLSMALSMELLEPRHMLSTLDFTGTDLSYNAVSGKANVLTVSLTGDTYTFTDSGERITAVTGIPECPTCKVKRVGKHTVKLTCPDAEIRSLTFNLGDENDVLDIQSARDALVVLGQEGVDTTVLTNNLQLSGGLSLDVESIHIVDSGVADAKVTTAGSQFFAGSVVLSVNAALEAAENVTFAGTVNGPYDLSIVSRSAQIGGPVGTSMPLTSFSIVNQQALSVSTQIVASGTVALTVEDDTGPGQDLTVEGSSKIESTGGNVSLRSGDNLAVMPGAELAAGQVIELQVDYGDADIGLGAAVTISGTISADLILLSGSDDDDTIILDDNGAAPAGTANNLRAPLNIDGGGGSNVLTVNDEGEIASTHVTVTDGSVGAGDGDNLFAPDGRLVYANIDDLRIATGSDADEITIMSTHVGSTLVDTGSGNDQVNLRATSGVTTINAGDGDDSILVSSVGQTVADITGVLHISAGAALVGDTLVIDNSASIVPASAELTFNTLSGLSPALVTYDSLEQLEIRFGTASDELPLSARMAASRTCL